MFVFGQRFFFYVAVSSKCCYIHLECPLAVVGGKEQLEGNQLLVGK